MYKCSIYEDRPEACREFPTHRTNFRHYPSCTFWFHDGVRQGKCSRCGECCKFNKVFSSACGPCSYLEDEING